MANLEELSYKAQLEFRNKALKSGSFMIFGEACDITEIIPEDPNSREGFLYSMYQAEKEYQKRHFSKEQKYKIPGRTEIPNTTKGYQRWIRDFVKMNENKGVTLPKDFSKKSKKQLVGMFYGMLKTYGINEEDILPR